MSGQLLVFVYENDNLQELGLFPIDETGAQARDALFAKNPYLCDTDQVLMLTQDVSLLRRCKLPHAAIENLHQVVGFELDRLTPFKPEQVYYSARILERIKESKQLRVEVALVLRDTLDPLLQAMHRCGWKPFRADIDEGVALTRRHELLPESFRIPRKRGPWWVAAAAGGVLMAIAGIALWLPLTMGETMASRLQAEIKAGNKVVAEVEALKTGAEKIRINANFIRRKKREEPRMLDMLEELTRILPDDTWLNGLQYDEHKLLVQGQSPNSTELIEKLEVSPYFQDVKFASPITKDANRIERFQISAAVINGQAN
ncbi:PilN domain-containing protein [Candidatus Methylospira mobilis]|uniref:PilN domain-containing protein n=1 Tax=Candidatus Methylospira mobilis TaxID=1808979 RepID=UPI0028F0D566|nr:PilN domain-containing protein [Candidatus Methylospira mobilis]WNV03288.1 PilN domain-containing protein [Candidatus Methylospira mobilis]